MEILFKLQRDYRRRLWLSIEQQEGRQQQSSICRLLLPLIRFGETFRMQLLH
jgi:hypothetical protein